MQAILKYLSTKSGKSVILTVETKSYIFNIFEGFQRYCIEKNVSLKYISAIFIPNKECIPPLCGLYLTLRDMNFTNLKIVCSDEVKILIETAFSFCPPNNLKLEFLRDFYEDEFITVNGQYNIQIKKVRGRFKVEDVPKIIPKHLYKELVSGKRIKVEDTFYDGSEYLEPEINFKKLRIVVDHRYENIDKDSKVLCFRKSDYDFLRHRVKDCWLLRDASGVDYVSQYNLLTGLNKMCEDYHLPNACNQKFKAFERSKCKLPRKMIDKRKSLGSGDYFTYNKDVQDFTVQKSQTVFYPPVKNQHHENSILFLGSGCAIPSKYRNVTGIIVSIHDKVFLFDCGEDSLHQIYRHYGSYKILDKIDSIFISHSHGDHSLGLINLAGKMKHKVKIFAPSSILNFVQSFHDNIIPFATDEAKFLERKFYRSYILQNEAILRYQNDLVNIVICGCPHNTDSCAVSLEYKDIKVSYSGDSRPSLLFANMAHKSDVLIHECTFDNESPDKALKTSHSTLNEAYEIFKISESKELLLTHFSQRYPKKFPTDSCGIPVHDFYNYRIGKSEYNEKDISEYLDTL